MKNKLCYILIGVLISFSFMGNVFAADLDFIVTATPSATTVVKGNEVKITLNLKSDSSIDVCQFQVTSDSTLEYAGMSTIYVDGNTWKVDGGISKFTLENDVDNTTPLTNGVNVLEIKYKVNGDGKVTVKTLECASVVDVNNATLGYHEDVVVSLTAKDISDDTTLSNLEVTNGTLLTPITTPTDNNQYIIMLDSPTFGLNPIASNQEYQDDIVIKNGNGDVISNWSNITFVGDGGQPQMIMSIVVNNTTTYNLLISYDPPELDNSLKSITINGVSLPLDECQDVCEYTIGKDVTSFEVVAVLSDSTNFKFSEKGNGPGNFVINDIVYVEIIVEPINNDSGAASRSYYVNVTREGALTDDSNKDDDEPSSGNTGTGGNTSNTGNGGSSGGNGGSTNNGGNVNNNPVTGDISMFLMAIILIASLVGSIILYQKNLESYK